MAGKYLTFSIEGDVQLSRNLLLLSERVKDWTPAFKETADTLKKIFQNDVFETQGGAIGESWSPLSRAYAQQKAKKYGNKGILQATGQMRAGFTTLVKPDMAEVSNRIDYFKYHQSNKPRSKIPRRVMMKLEEHQKQIVVKIFHTYFYKAMQK